MNRRTFLKNGCLACVAVAATGTLLGSCRTLTVVQSSVSGNQVAVSSKSFLEGNSMITIRTKELNYDILLHRLSEKEYKALYLQCTHQDNPLVATSTGLYCNSHGSRFDLDGKVQAGPASRNLKMYRTSVEGEQVIIYLS